MSGGSAGAVAAVREELTAGGVTGPRDLAERLAARGVDLDANDLRSALRSLGAMRVEGANGPVLAIPVSRDAAGGSSAGPPRPAGSRLQAAVAADADWPIQVAVIAVVAVLLVVAFAGWLIAP